MSDDTKNEVKNDAEDYAAPGWRNPYVLYIVLMLALFGFLILMAYLAWTNDWIPHRGVGGR